MIAKLETGRVIHYGYLWKSEQDAGLEEGRKIRPCAIVTAVTGSGDAKIAYVLPITHSEPGDKSCAVELPLAVKKYLGMDEERSWVICNEVNEFVWPGFDLNQTPDGRDSYGILPSRLFDKIREKYSVFLHGNDLKIVNRDCDFPHP